MRRVMVFEAEPANVEWLGVVVVVSVRLWVATHFARQPDQFSISDGIAHCGSCFLPLRMLGSMSAAGRSSHVRCFLWVFLLSLLLGLCERHSIELVVLTLLCGKLFSPGFFVSTFFDGQRGFVFLAVFFVPHGRTRSTFWPRPRPAFPLHNAELRQSLVAPAYGASLHGYIPRPIFLGPTPPRGAARRVASGRRSRQLVGRAPRRSGQGTTLQPRR